MTTKKLKRREWLFRQSGGLVTTECASIILGVAVVTFRTYKRLGIIDPYVKMNQKDLYDIDEIKWVSKRLASLKAHNWLRDIVPIIAEELRKRRIDNPIEYEIPFDRHIIC